MSAVEPLPLVEPLDGEAIPAPGDRLRPVPAVAPVRLLEHTHGHCPRCGSANPPTAACCTECGWPAT